MARRTVEPVTLGGWYRNTDDTWTYYRWDAGQLIAGETVDIPPAPLSDRELDAIAAWQAAQREWSGKALRRQVVQRGLSLAELGRRLGVPRQRVNDWLNVPPRAETVGQIIELLGCSWHDLTTLVVPR